MPFMEREQSMSLWPSSDISQGSSLKLLCSLSEENCSLCGPGPAKGSDPSHWGHGSSQCTRGRGTLYPDASASPTTGDSRCSVWSSSCASPVSNGGGLKFV